ncbi:MAG: tetratricopeptide repeat protein [bacterium]|nr:tetratricopeptide repeat protein [bacterium]
MSPDKLDAMPPPASDVTALLDAWIDASLGRVLHAQGLLDEAEGVLTETLAIRRRLRGEQALFTRRAWKRLEAFSRRDDRPQGEAEGGSQPGPSKR